MKRWSQNRASSRRPSARRSSRSRCATSSASGWVDGGDAGAPFLAIFSQTPGDRAWWRSSQRSQARPSAELEDRGARLRWLASCRSAYRRYSRPPSWHLPMAKPPLIYDLMLLLSTSARGGAAREDPHRRRDGDRGRRRHGRAQRRLGHAAAGVRIDHQTEAEYHLLQFAGPTDAARVALAQPADRRRRAALPDHQGPAGHAAAAGPARRRWSPARRPRRPPRHARRRLSPPRRARSPPAAIRAHARVRRNRVRPGGAAPAGDRRPPIGSEWQRDRVALVTRLRVATATFPSIFRRSPGLPTAPRLDSRYRLSIDPWKGAIEHGCHQHQPGRADRKPDPGPGAAHHRQRHVDLQAAASPATRGARTTPPGSGRTSPTTSTSRCGARRARTAGSYLSKGRPVAIDGRLEWREYEVEGQKRQSVDIIADSVQFLGGRDDAGQRERVLRQRPRRRRATSRSTPATSRPLPWLPEPPTTTFRSEARDQKTTGTQSE